MMTTDLFGNERWEPGAATSEPTVLSLFDAAAEANALASGRALSQERAEIIAPPGGAPCTTTF